MFITADDISKDAGILLNDVKLTRFTFTLQLPYINMAYGELGEQLEYSDVSFVKESSAVIKVPVGQRDIGGPSGIKLPDNLISPKALFERMSGANSDFVQMAQVEFLPNPQPETLTNAFIYWTWQNQEFWFTGANCDIDVRIDYIANQFVRLTKPDDQVLLFNARSFLGFRTAALCAEFIGEDQARAGSLNGNAGAALDRIIGITTKEMQGIRTRRRPFRSGYKSNSWI